MLQHLVLHVQRYQAILHLVLIFDACKMLVQQLATRGVPGELEHQQLLHQTSYP